MRSRVVSSVLVLAPLAASGCATAPPESPPDRELFRLGPVEVLPSVEAGVSEDASGPPVGAFRAELRFLRADGTTLAAPRLVVLPGQRATIEMVQQISYVQDFDVARAGDDWVADPVIGVVAPGVRVDLTVLEADSNRDGRTDEAALAWSVVASDLRRPIAHREVGALATGTPAPVTVQFPRWESVEVSGARRIAVGEDAELARFPDPAGSGDVVLRGRVERVIVPGPVEGPAVRPDEGPDGPHRVLRDLGRSAAGGASAGRLRVSAVRLPPGFGGPDSRGVERLATIAVASVMAPGVRGADLLRETYLADWDVETTSRIGVFDPVVGTQESGISAEVGPDGRLLLRWRTTPRWDRFSIAPGGTRSANLTNAESVIDPSLRLTLDQPESSAVERSVPLEPGRSVHPFFRLPDGGTAALVVEFDPGR